MSFLGFGCLTRSQSKRVGSDMDMDTPASSSRASPAHPFVDGTINELMAERDVWLCGRTKKDKFRIIKDRAYKLTPAYHPQLLRDTSMDVEFNTIFAAIGWRNLVPINEPGVKLLTIEFLCTLQILEAGAGVSFRMFNRHFTCTWRRLSDLLGLIRIVFLTSMLLF
jgi:hypothetical protein